MRRSFFVRLFAFVTFCGLPHAAFAAPALSTSPYITDSNRNNVIDIAAFGDSITRGIGDLPPGPEGVFDPFQPREEAGYPLRLEQVLGIPISNNGIPGEFLTEEGIGRFIRLILNSPPDLIIVSGGSNDARLGRSSAAYFHAVQKMINVARVQGVQVMLLTPPPECCNHEPFAGAVSGYIGEMRNLAVTNDLPIADSAHAFANTCNISECELLNLPEGLHPNSVGYDVISEVVLGALFQFDIFTPAGQTAYEQAFGLPAGALIVVPDAVPAGPTPTPTRASGV